MMMTHSAEGVPYFEVDIDAMCADVPELTSLSRETLLASVALLNAFVANIRMEPEPISVKKLNADPRSFLRSVRNDGVARLLADENGDPVAALVPMEVFNAYLSFSLWWHRAVVVRPSLLEEITRSPLSVVVELMFPEYLAQPPTSVAST